MPVEMRPLAGLRSFQNVDDHVVDAVAVLIRRRGFKKPIVVIQRGIIVAGDLYYHAARKLGRTEVPVKEVAAWTPAQARAYDRQEEYETPFNSADNLRQNLEWYAKRKRPRQGPAFVPEADPFEGLRHATVQGQRQWLRRHSEADWLKVPISYWRPQLQREVLQASQPAIPARAEAPGVPRIHRLRDVQAILREILSDGSRLPAKGIIAAALGAGIGERTLSRAKARLGVRTERVGFGPGGHFVWYLASQAA